MGKLLKKGVLGTVKLYIRREDAVRKLQVSEKEFRHLCIVKGIFPRDPRQKNLRKGHKNTIVYYLRKDIQMLLHEPTLKRIRDLKIHKRKMTRLVSRNEWCSAEAMEGRKPEHKYDHLIKERYPEFQDAIQDLGDALNMLFLFSAMPQIAEITFEMIEECKKRTDEFINYVTSRKLLTKAFVSIKGIYYQATIHGVEVTWLVPHPRAPVIPNDVDYDVMYSFLHMYEAMVKFILFKLYKDAGMNYPRIVACDLEPLTPQLFLNSSFYISREVNQNALSFLINSMGGRIVSKDLATHIITERNSGIQPQYLFDCLNQNKVLIPDNYAPNKELPPHLSPFVDPDDELEYNPMGNQTLDVEDEVEKERLRMAKMLMSNKQRKLYDSLQEERLDRKRERNRLVEQKLFNK